MILKAILLGSLLFRPSITNYDDPNEEQRFDRAIKYWTETLCTLQKTKTMVFHGIFTNGTKTLQEFFDVLLRTTTEYCNTVILLKTHQNENTNIRHNGDDKLVIDQTQGTKRHRQLTPMMNLLRHKWNIRRNWRQYDEYYIDIWNINIIFLGDNEAFEKLLNTSMTLNSREHFIVLAVWNDDLAKLSDSRQLIDRTLRKLWLEQRVLNVLFNEPLSNHGFNLYKYNPFARNDEKSWGRLERVETTSQRKILRLLSTLCHRRTVNFYGYKFNVSIFDQGVEGMKIRGKIDPDTIYVHSGGYNSTSGILLGVLALKTNFTVNVVEPVDNKTHGYRMGNGTYVEAIGDVIRHKVIASFASFFVKRYVNNDGLEFTTTVGFDEVCVITPRAAKIPKGLRMYRIFRWSVWLCIVLSYIFVYLAWYYARLFESRSAKVQKVDGQRIALHTLLITSGYPIPLPVTTSERCLLLGLFISSVTIIGVFNGVLYTMFANDMHYKEIDTLDELDASGLPIGCTINTKDIFGSEKDVDLNPVRRRLVKKMIYVRNSMEMTAIYRNMTSLLRKQHYLLLSGPLRNKNGRKLVHRVEECPDKYFLACVLPRNSFLRERINTLISRLNQAGLPALWKTRTILERGLKMKLNLKKPQDRKNDDFEALRLNDLHVCFVILAIGLLAAGLVFCNEKDWLKLDCKKIFW